MKNILLTLLFLQTILATTVSQESVQVDFTNYLSAELNTSSCTYSINGINMKLLDPDFFPPVQLCTPPQSYAKIFIAEFSRCDIPLSTSPGILQITSTGGCVGFYIRINYTDGSFDESYPTYFMSVDESIKEIQSILIEESTCGLAFFFNGQQVSDWNAANITFTKTETPFLISPINEEKNQKVDTLIFDWFVSDENEEYLFQVDTTNLFMNPFFQDVVKGGTDTLYSLEYNRDYYWRVKKKNTYCSNAWSDTFKFSTIIRLDIFQHIIEKPLPQDRVIFRDSLLSTMGNVIEYDVAADGSLTMFLKYNRGNINIRDFAGWPESGFVSDSISTDGFKWKKYEAPRIYDMSKVVYLDYKHDPNSQDIDFTIRLNIKPTPVIFLHGLFSNGSIWSPIENALAANQWDNIFLVSPSYQNDISFQASAANVDSYVDNLLNTLRTEEIFINKVSLVGHSMGGLVERQFLLDNKNKPRIKNISRIITLNTPHSGSKSANYIIDFAIGEWVATHLFEPRGISNNDLGTVKINNGAVSSLRVNSSEMDGLFSSNVPIPSHAISTDLTNFCNDLEFDLALQVGELLINRLFKIHSSLRSKIEEFIHFFETAAGAAGVAGCALSDYLLQDAHDGIVELKSQKGGLSGGNNSNYTGSNANYFHMFTHGEQEIIGKLKTLLESDPFTPSFSQDGFHPMPILPPMDLSVPTTNEYESLSDTIVEINVLNIQQSDTLCYQSISNLSIDGSSNTNAILVMYFYDNDSLRLDSIFSNSHDFEIPLFSNYEGNIHIGIIGSDGYGNFDFDTLSIYVKNSISVEPSISITSNITEICTGQEVTFNSATVNPGVSPAYQWFVNDVSVGNNSPFYSSTTLTNGAIIYCSMTSSIDCANPETVNSNPITISVTPSVIPTIDVVASNSSICIGEEVIFTATVSNEGLLPNYQWFMNGNPVGSNSSIYASTNISDGDEIFCQLTSNAECATPSIVSSSALTISVNQTSEPNLEISASSISICEGEEVEFNAFPTNGGASPSYQWFVNGMAVGANNSTFSSSSLSDGAQVYCEMTSSSNCADPMEAISSVITISVNAIAVPEVEIIASATSICTGEEITFTANSINGGDTPEYQWFVDGIAVGTNNSSYTTNQLISGSVVTCNLSSSEECANPVDVSSNAISIEVTTLAIPDLAISQDTIYATNYGSGQSTFEWYLNGVFISSEPFVICQSPGQYELFVTLDNCTVSNTLEVQVCSVSTVDDEIFSSISIFPNPASNTVIIEGREVLGRNFLIRLRACLEHKFCNHRILDKIIWLFASRTHAAELSTVFS